MKNLFRTLATVGFVGYTFAIIGCDNPNAMGNRSNQTEMDRDSRTIPGSINGAGTSTDSSVTNGRNPNGNMNSNGSSSSTGR